MHELIKITTGEQGSSVVSARELHSFLEVKSRFNDWIKRRIIKYKFRQDVDYVEVEGFYSDLSKTLDGRPETEYALTLDMAKELSMVENNTKGREARQYFINAEKALRQAGVAPALTTEQMLIQLVSQQTQSLEVTQHILAETQLKLAQLRADVEEIRAGQKPAKRLPTPPHLQVGSPAKKSPSALRQLISRKVNDYCGFHGAEQSETYNYLYKRLHDVYGVNVHRLHRKPGEYIIDAVERYGHLDKVYSLIVAELNYVEE